MQRECAELSARRGGVEARLHILVAMQEHPVIRDGFLEELFDEKQL